MEFLRYIPKSYLSWFVGSLVHMRLPQPLAAFSIRVFARLYKIDPALAERPLESYRSIGDFFIRNLRSDVRPLGDGVVCPVDGTLRICEDVPADGQLVQTKGKSYSMARLLGSDELCSRFAHGQVWNFYLSPTDAHHIFSPVDGEIVKTVYIPGSLWPVNDWAIKNVDGLFAANERIVTFIESDVGLVAVVMVGATNVGRIRASYTDLETNLTPWKKRARTEVVHEPRVPVSRGDKIGTFLMGSSVVLLTERRLFQLREFALLQKVTYGVSLRSVLEVEK